MRALVTGGAGFIGSNLVARLLEFGHPVVVFDNFSTGRQENLPHNSGLVVHKGDIRDYSQVLRTVKGVDVVFHMAAQVGNVLSLQRPDSDLQTNALGTLNVLKACKEHGVKDVIFSSSSAVFGETRYVPVDEEHPRDPLSPYGLSKLAAEKYCLILAAEYGFHICCLRYFNVYGINQRFNPYGNVIPIFVERALEGKPLTIYGDGFQTRDFIDVRDIVNSNILAQERGVEGIFNIGTGTAMSVNELAEHVLKAVGKDVGLVHAPPRSGEVRHSVADISKARRELNFLPSVSIEQGVLDYISWFAKTHSIVRTGKVGNTYE
jgi:UDP-glucose 4-epimerase